MTTFVRTELSWTAISQSPLGSNIEWLVTKIQQTSVVNVYKPPPSVLTASSLPSVTAPAIYAGDFNCQHPDWGYNYTTQEGRMMNDWASNAEALLLFDPKEPPSFFSARWNTRIWPLLCVAVTTRSLRDVSLAGFPAHTTDRLSSKCHHWCSR